jgi:large subunit ribosomal protein L25
VSGEIAPGDSLLNQQLVQIPVEADATNIPQGIDVDVEGMDIGDAVHASDLKLPQGVTLQVEPDTLVLHVIAQQAAEEPEAAEGEGEAEVPESVDSVADESRGGEEESAG